MASSREFGVLMELHRVAICGSSPINEEITSNPAVRTAERGDDLQIQSLIKEESHRIEALDHDFEMAEELHQLDWMIDGLSPLTEEKFRLVFLYTELSIVLRERNSIELNCKNPDDDTPPSESSRIDLSIQGEVHHEFS